MRVRPSSLRHELTASPGVATGGGSRYTILRSTSAWSLFFADLTGIRVFSRSWIAERIER